MGTREYPLVVERWGEEAEFVVSRGHHPPCAFLRRAIRLVARDEREDAREDPARDEWSRNERREILGKLGHGDMKHEWRRYSAGLSRGAEGTEWEGARFYVQADGPGSGAFPVTVVQLW